MKIFLQSFILALFVLVMSIPAEADYYTGNDLAEDCEAKNNMLKQGACIGFVTGLNQGVFLTSSISKSKKIFCAPRGVSVGQLVKVAVKFMKENPEVLHLSAGIILMRAYRVAFPCNEQ